MGRAVSSHPMYQMPDKWKEGGRCIGGGDANADLAHPAPLGAWIWQGQRVAQGGMRAERRQQRDRRPALLINPSSSRSTGSMLKRTAGPPSSQSSNPWARKSCWKALWDLQKSSLPAPGALFSDVSQKSLSKVDGAKRRISRVLDAQT